VAKHIVIIGGGPGGYVAAIRAAQLGAQVTLIERDTLGGTCLNRGCFPTKVLLHSVHTLAKARNAATFGVSTGKVSLDFSAVIKQKEAVVQQLVASITTLLKLNNVEVIKGVGTLIDPNTVGILGETSRISADSIIIATGSKPVITAIRGIDEPGVMNSDQCLAMEQPPKDIIIIGGGVIGVEFAEIMHGLGSKVTIIEIMPQILPTADTEIANMLEDLFKKEGIEIFTEATVTAIRSAGQDREAVSFTTKDNGGQERIAEKVLVAVGRQPNTEDLQADKLGLTLEKDRLVVNERMETNIPGIYAIGDVVGGAMLAHVAMKEGKCAAENSLGADSKMNYQAIPWCMYTSPEMAWVGLTEAEAKREYGNIKIGRFPLFASGRAITLVERAGMVKIIAETRYGQILGVHILGPHATELIAEAVLGMRMEATFEDIASTIHAHPTISEAVMEAALDVEGKRIHY